MVLVLLIVVLVFLYLCYFFSLIEESWIEGIGVGLMFLWGSIFMIMLFLIIMGFEFKVFLIVMDWFELSSFGLVLVGFVLMGGGIVMIVGGVKLLWIYVLFWYLEWELEWLVYLLLVGGSG